MTPKKVGIAIDKWKLATFTRHLTEAGFAFEKFDGVTADTWLLRVETKDVDALAVVVKAANDESRTS